MLVGAISAIYMVSKGVDVVDIGLIKAFQASIILLLDIPLAYFADKKSRKLSVVLGTFFAVLWLFTMGLSNNLQTFYLAEFFNAISLALLSGSFISYLIDNTKEIDKNIEIKSIVGNFSKYQHVGMGIAALLGSLFITVESSWIWFFSAFLLTIQLIIFSPLLPKDVNICESDHDSPYKEIFSIFKDILRHKEIKWVYFILILVSIYYQSIIQFWQIILGSKEENFLSDGYIYGLVFIAILFIQAYSGHLVEKHSLKNILKIIIFTSPFVFAMPYIMVLDSFYGMVFGISLVFFLTRIIILTLQSIAHEKIPSRLRSSYDSVLSTIVRLLLLGFIPLFGLLIQMSGAIILYLFFLVIFIVFIFYFNLKNK